MGVLLHADPVAHALPGGIGAYVRELVDALLVRPDAPALELLVSRSAGELPTGWDALRVRRAALPLRALYAAWNGARLPRSGRGADVVHATNLVLPPGGRALVATVHDLNVDLHPELVPQPWRALYRRGLHLAVRHADLLLVSTEATASILRRDYAVPADRLALTPFGPGLDPASPQDPAAPARLGVRAPYVLSVGTLEPRKNQAALVRAFAAADLPAHQLVLAGSPGWGAEAVRDAVAASGCADRIVVTGTTARAELAALYAGADAFALPSHYEGFGLPLLEALGFGLPCVTSTDPALVEVAGAAALHVAADDVDGLAHALTRLASDDDLRARLRAAGPQRAAAFSWEHTAASTVEAYRRVGA